jgi:DNA-binding transcriptional ArsR family regulator
MQLSAPTRAGLAPQRGARLVLTKLIFQCYAPPMPRRVARLRPLDAAPGPVAPADAPAGLAVVDRDAAASALADPMRRRVLAVLRSPGSATTVARELGLTRQRVNYHVRALEAAGLIEEVERRQRRGVVERVVRATAAHYLVAPDALGTMAAAAAGGDRFSATYQVAVAARTIREVADLAEIARRTGKRLTTLTLDTSVTFATPAVREAFANELVAEITRLVAKYHQTDAASGRAYRLFVGAHPAREAGRSSR